MLRIRCRKLRSQFAAAYLLRKIHSSQTQLVFQVGLAPSIKTDFTISAEPYLRGHHQRRGAIGAASDSGPVQCSNATLSVPPDAA